jgi:hypothetical protein
MDPAYLAISAQAAQGGRTMGRVLVMLVIIVVAGVGLRGGFWPATAVTGLFAITMGVMGRHGHTLAWPITWVSAGIVVLILAAAQWAAKR